MNSARRRSINRFAETVREACGLTTPVSLDDMKNTVHVMGGSIEYREVGFADDFDASVGKIGTGFVIKLPASGKPEVREKFSLGHEIGHLLLHMGYLIDKEKWDSINEYTDSSYNRLGRSEEESEANEFAAALLMPEEEFRSVAQRSYTDDGYSIGPIARHFQVSELAATTRGKWLGLFAWD